MVHSARQHANPQLTLTVTHEKGTAAAAKALQSCPTLCSPIDGSPPGSPVSGIFQARTLEWVAISFSNAWKWKVKGKPLSRIRLLVTPWTAAYQAPSFIGFSGQEYWSGVPFPSSEKGTSMSILQVRNWGSKRIKRLPKSKQVSGRNVCNSTNS